MGDSTIRNKQRLTEEEFLQTYDISKYDRPSVTVDMLIFTVMDEACENYRKLPEKVFKVLMIKRGEHPYLGQWALPGGFVAMSESLDEAAMRELRTETNIDNIYMEQLYTWGDVNRDPRTKVISCSYMALVDSKSLAIKAGDDAADAKWFHIKYSISNEKKTLYESGYEAEKTVTLELVSDENTVLSAIVKVTETARGKVLKIQRDIIESKGIAFDHAKMIEYAIERLRNKIEYTDIVFNLMPDTFALTELQQVYEVILGKELLAAAFRRKIADMVVETDKYTKDAGHRPSKLFKYNPNWKNERK